MEQTCNKCGYFNPEDQKCYYFVDQEIDFEGGKAKPMYTQPDDDACEVYMPKEEY